MGITVTDLMVSEGGRSVVVSVQCRKPSYFEKNPREVSLAFDFIMLIKVFVVFLALGWAFLSPVKSYAGKTDGLGLCPQSREKTPKAPEEYLQKVNPLEKNSKNLKKGKLLYMVRAKTLQCKHCHGNNGDGRGEMALDSFPAPRNFTCKEMMKAIPDGQLFWAIEKGLPHTSMPSYDNLSDKQVWQLILYIRNFVQ